MDTNNPSINNDIVKEKRIDHLILLVHGIGKHEENWRSKITRINVLYETVCRMASLDQHSIFVGVEWHSALHQQTDTLIQKVTPPSIPVIHSLINHTLLDLLFWTSPTYSQTIYTEVGTQLNNIYHDFLKKHPTFNGKVHILAHSLGSMITYDILCHQTPSSLDNNSSNNNSTSNSNSNNNSVEQDQQGNIALWREQKRLRGEDDGLSRSSESGGDSLLPHLILPKLDFDVHNLFCIGSPIGLLYTIRGHSQLTVPKCTNLFNIIDPSDPVGYLIEPLIDEGFSKLGESIVPHIVSKKVKPPPSTSTMPTFSENLSSKFSKFTNKLNLRSLSLRPNGTTPNGTPIKDANGKEVVELQSISYNSSTSSFTSSTSSTSLSTSTITSSTTNIIIDGATVTPPPSSTPTNNSTPSSLSYNSTSVLTSISNPSSRKTTPDPSDDESSISDSEVIEVLDQIDRSNYNNNNSTTSTTSTISNTSSSTSTSSSSTTPSSSSSSSSSSKGEKFFGGHRFDYKLKPSGLLNAVSEYSSVPGAHKSYWSSKDVMFFIAEHLHSIRQ